ncbi:alpha/beta hydrolase [Achromobacter pestifer]|uniref:Alpha/beta hydrolase n=1 Tax=Achromobacter pestifer TaxID=1353889 RepID=A0A7D4DZT2_9BURK|nr:alpha/beta hydrolase [Achromobacter pestifer]QKH38015.1 alpha/beta hydrolase [Achromobacter pestifer]
MEYTRRGSGRPLFLLHGFCSSSAIWDGLAGALAQERDVIAPDWPGFGRDAQAAPLQGLPAYADAIVALADELGIGTFDVLGHSFSGFVAQQLLCAAPARLGRTVLYGAGLRVDRAARFEPMDQTLARLRADGPRATARRVLETWFRAGEQAPAYAACLEDGMSMSAAGAASMLAAVEGVDYTQALAAVRAPVLVISGEHERSHPLASALDLRAALTHGSLCVLPDCGHAAHLERPLLFNTAVREFLARR